MSANQVKIQVSKETLGGIPIWIIIISILIGLLILALVIFVLWKVMLQIIWEHFGMSCGQQNKKTDTMFGSSSFNQERF